VANEGHEFALLKEFARQGKDFGVATEFVGHKAAGDEETGEVMAVGIFQEEIAFGRVAVFAGVGFEFERRDFGFEAGFLKAEQRIPQFQVFIDVVDERENVFHN
jgi:hypothetical protein